jgi:hypothetical protein
LSPEGGRWGALCVTVRGRREVGSSVCHCEGKEEGGVLCVSLREGGRWGAMCVTVREGGRWRALCVTVRVRRKVGSSV